MATLLISWLQSTWVYYPSWRKCHHFDNIFVTGCVESCKYTVRSVFRQNNISISVSTYIVFSQTSRDLIRLHDKHACPVHGRKCRCRLPVRIRPWVCPRRSVRPSGPHGWSSAHLDIHGGGRFPRRPQVRDCKCDVVPVLTTRFR